MLRLLLVKERILHLLFKLFFNICHILESKHHETCVKICKIYESEDV